MSVAKVVEVQKSRKDQGKCEKCGVELPAGTAYRWFTVGFRSKRKHTRCMKSECFPKPSERESSKLAAIYAAQEQFDVSELDNKDDVETAVQEIATTIREVAEEYREAGTDQYGTEFNADSIERADTLESSADELENWTYEGDDEAQPCDDHEEIEDDCEACQESFSDWLNELHEAAKDAVDNVEMP